MASPPTLWELVKLHDMDSQLIGPINWGSFFLFVVVIICKLDYFELNILPTENEMSISC